MDACTKEPLLPFITPLNVEMVEASFVFIVYNDALMLSMTGERISIIKALSQVKD